MHNENRFERYFLVKILTQDKKYNVNSILYLIYYMIYSTTKDVIKANEIAIKPKLDKNFFILLQLLDYKKRL